jgi:Sulfotransferase domain/7 transmembrane sweet-taste receptor of 3 GCPR
MLCAAVFQSWQSRHLSTEFQESQYIFRALLGILLVTFIGVPVLIIAQDNTNSHLFVSSAIIFVTCLLILLLIFVPKIQYEITRKSTRRGITQISGLDFSAANTDGSSLRRGSMPESALLAGVSFASNTDDDCESSDSGEQIYSTKTQTQLVSEVTTLKKYIRVLKNRQEVANVAFSPNNGNDEDDSDNRGRRPLVHFAMSDQNADEDDEVDCIEGSSSFIKEVPNERTEEMKQDEMKMRPSPTIPMMEKVNDRFVLSVILSFLTETEGTSLLMCRKMWTKKILPIFRLPTDNESDQTKHRHRFIEYPVPDATTRLDRINTRKWRKKYNQFSVQQQRQFHNMGIGDLAKQEWIERALQASTLEECKHGDFISAESYSVPSLLQFWSPKLERSLLQSAPQQSPLFKPGITLLASYPRSGNTYVRSLLESITGFVTLSDTRADRPLSIALANQHGLVGEGLAQAPICKTHWPERMGCCKYKASRVILLVRNPYDVIDSYWHLNATNTHTKKVTPQVYKDHQAMFQALVRNEVHVWSEFLEFYQQQSVPVLLVRYEDLILNPQREMRQMLEFCTPTDWWQPRFQAVLGKEESPHWSHGYQSCNSTSTVPSFGRSLSSGIYHPELLEDLHSKMGALDPHGWIERLGYSIWTPDEKFPNNLECFDLQVPGRDKVATSTTETLAINDNIAMELRPRDSPYGRNFRNWRRQHTKDDQEPFPTVNFETKM